MAEKIPHILVFVASLAAWATPSVAQTPIDACTPSLAALNVDRFLESIVVDMWQRAPTFRRQVVRLANEPRLVVTVAVWQYDRRSGHRARTLFTREGEHLRRADVQVKPLDQLAIVELIAHELEHVLEQLDGVDLARLGGHGGVRVSRGRDVYAEVETERAQQIGLIVGAEFYAQAAPAALCTEPRP